MPARYYPNVKPPVQVIAQILQQLNKLHPLSEALKQALIDHSFEARIKKGQHLLREGDYSKYFYFLITGIVTGYRKIGQKKLITFICVDGDIISAIEGMYGITPCDENIIAEEDTYLVAIRTEDLIGFFNTFPEINIIVRKILEQHYIAAHERAVITRMGNGVHKYNYYLKALPGHVDKVPVELVASFLDMKPETLQKIKKAAARQQQSVSIHEKAMELAHCMSRDKLYQKKKLSLKAMAEHLQLTAHELSGLLNQVYHQNFAGFINTHRVNFVKEQLKNKSNFKLTTIEALGDQAGFSSKSTFFAAFKKLTGVTPLVYANKADTA